MTSFYLIRHARTDAVGKRLSGRMPGVHISAEGITQAEHLATRMKKYSVSRIYSSPLERAMSTAYPISALLHLPTVPLDGLLELDYGSWTNASIESLKGDPQFRLFNSFRSITRIPGGESMQEAQTRMVNCLNDLCKQHPNEHVAVVSHGDMIKAAIAFYTGISLDLMHRLEISPASISILELHDETARLLLLNSTE